MNPYTDVPLTAPPLKRSPIRRGGLTLTSHRRHVAADRQAPFLFYIDATRLNRTAVASVGYGHGHFM